MGLTKKNALDLMTNLMDRESVNSEGNIYKLPDFEEVNCAKQRNGFDCGPFILGFMLEAIEKIKEGGVPRNLSAPPAGALDLRNLLAELIDGSIIKNPKFNEKSDLMIDNAKKLNNKEIVAEVNESIEMTYNRLDKLLDEKIENSEDKKSNNKNDIDKNRAQNFIVAQKALDEIMIVESDLDKQKPNKNDSIGKEKSKDNHKDTNKTKEKIENSKDNKKKQEEIKTMNENSSKYNREMQNRNLGSKNRGRECRYYVNDSCRYGSLCRYTHREVCSAWKRNGNCGNSKCTFDHPEPCMNHLKGSCRRGSCWFLHTLERADPGRDMHQEIPTLMQKQQKHSEVGRKQNHNQNFWNGQNRKQEIQRKKTLEEEKIITQQQSIHLMMGAMETLRMGLEQIMLKTNKQ